MPIIAPLFLALAEYLTSRREPKAIAEQWRIPLPEFLAGFQKIEQHFWRSRLARALENPAQRPDLIPLLTELSQKEDQYSDLMYQYHRAEQVAAAAETYGDEQFSLKLKINSLCFRIHQAASRITREMQKSRIAFEKAEKQELPTTPAPVRQTKQAPAGQAGPQAGRQVGTKHLSPTPQPNHSPEQVATKPVPPAAVETPPQIVSPQPVPQAPPLVNQDPKIELPVKPKYTPEPVDPLVQNCLAKNRQRIRNTPAKDRKALIERLIAKERAKPSNIAA